MAKDGNKARKVEIRMWSQCHMLALPFSTSILSTVHRNPWFFFKQGTTLMKMKNRIDLRNPGLSLWASAQIHKAVRPPKGLEAHWEVTDWLLRSKPLGWGPGVLCIIPPLMLMSIMYSSYAFHGRFWISIWSSSLGGFSFISLRKLSIRLLLFNLLETSPVKDS